MPRFQFIDQQQALSFMMAQASYIESEVYRQKYPDIIYQQLVPVDTSAPEWVKSITFFSIDHVGQAQWFHHSATDMRLADLTRQVKEQGVEMAGIGYRYTLEEIGQAQQLGVPLTSERAAAAVRAYEEFCNQIALTGDTGKAWTGLLNDGVVAATNSAVPWATATSDQIIADINTALTAIWTTSNTVEMADTILLPLAQYTLLSTKRLDSNNAISILEWISKYNVYTQQTGQALTIRAVLQLVNAGAGATARMVVYRRAPDVVKMYMPMPHRFLPVWQTGPLVFDIPGIFRLGGVNIRRPASFRYLDAI